ncbi:CopG family transcriptional regulator [Ideonella sp.]|uniref:CopG family transcriptional regulator n=1 Tax=Ideonella sp. TaxID=1929293 RepID=UPI002B49BA01|nr:CopG family transcriptional regulator [Ideonella sp.]HJV68161.1 CopG family transcriptional regulator [Ideonella sp.]
MELKTARLTLLIDPNKKAAFERLCAQLDLTASQVVRRMIRDFLAQHGVSYVPSGEDEDTADAAPLPRAPKRKPATTPAPAPKNRRSSRT